MEKRVNYCRIQEKEVYRELANQYAYAFLFINEACKVVKELNGKKLTRRYLSKFQEIIDKLQQHTTARYSVDIPSYFQLSLHRRNNTKYSWVFGYNWHLSLRMEGQVNKLPISQKIDAEATVQEWQSFADVFNERHKEYQDIFDNYGLYVTGLDEMYKQIESWRTKIPKMMFPYIQITPKVIIK